MENMKRQLIHLALLVGAVSPVLAQEPRQKEPAPGQLRTRERTMVVSPDVEGRIYYFNANRGRMGITVSTRPEATDSIGALVDAVSPGSPAFKAGVQSGDIITRFNGRSLPVMTRETRKVSPGLALLDIAVSLAAGDTARLEYRRGGNRRQATVVLAPLSDFEPGRFGPVPFGNEPPILERNWDQFMQPSIEMFGPGEGERKLFLPFRMVSDLELAPMNPGLGQYFGVTTGVLVINVPERTTLNLRSGDVVTLVDGRRVSNPSQFFRVLFSYEPGEQFRFEIVRMKRRETVTGSLAER
jgi:membrane-associated protease RseP (regulator of RpoE activity)